MTLQQSNFTLMTEFVEFFVAHIEGKMTVFSLCDIPRLLWFTFVRREEIIKRGKLSVWSVLASFSFQFLHVHELWRILLSYGNSQAWALRRWVEFGLFGFLKVAVWWWVFGSLSSNDIVSTGALLFFAVHYVGIRECLIAVIEGSLRHGKKPMCTFRLPFAGAYDSSSSTEGSCHLHSRQTSSCGWSSARRGWGLGRSGLAFLQMQSWEAS